MLKIAVLGCGRIGRMHAEMLARRVPHATLGPVFDLDSGAAADIAGRHGVDAASSVEHLLGSGVDAVAICTSTDTHADLIEAAAAAGLATFCEKPISLDLAAVDRALAAVDRAGTYLQIAFNRRFDPSHQAVRDAVAAGEIGELELLRITSRDPAPPPIEYLAGSGGLFCDMMIHDFDMARYVAGSDVVELHATGAVRVDPAIAEVGDIDTAVVVMRHASGCITTIDNSRRAVYGYDQRVEAFGSAGVVASDNPPVNATWRRDATGFSAAPIGEFFLERYEQAYLRQWAAFVAAVASGSPSPVSGADGRAPLVMAVAANESLRTGRPVALT